MALSWVSVNANDGSIIADLPGLLVDGALTRTIGRAETLSAKLPLGPSHIPTQGPNAGATFRRAPLNWEAATREKAVFLVALDENESPVWGGMVTEKTTTHRNGVALSLATAEDCLNDRYVGNEPFAQKPQNTIVKTLVEKYAWAGNPLPIRVKVLPGPDPLRDRTYLDADDKSLLSVLEELSGVEGGPEWTIGWEWEGDKLFPVLYVGGRLGAAAPADLGASAQFHLPGNVLDAELVRSYKRGAGANDVMATSSGTGNARPQSPRQTNRADMRPTVEFRWSPSTSITNVSTLTTHARRALAGMKDGSVTLSITANRKTAPAFGLGDDIGFDLTGPAWPRGLTGTARVLGIQRTNTTVTPILDVRTIEGII